MLRVLLTVLMSVIATVSIASPSRDDIKTMLNTGDYEGLETALRGLHEIALETKDYKFLYEIDRLFATTHPVWQDTINAWAEQHPDSGYAMTAKYSMHMHVAYQYRGTETWARTSETSLRLFNKERRIGDGYAAGASKLLPDYPPATNAVLDNLRYVKSQGLMASTLEKIFEVTPSINALKRAIYSESRAWGGSDMAVIDLCTRFADRLEDYDLELCIIQAALAGHLSQETMPDAYEIYKNREGGINESRHLLYYMRHPETEISDEEMARMRKYYLTGPIETIGIDNYLALLWKVAPRNQPNINDYVKTVYKRADDYIDQRLEESPLDRDLLKLSIESHMRKYRPGRNDGHLDAASDLWEGMLEYGGHLPETWTLGAKIQHEKKDTYYTLAAHPYLVNRAVLMNDPTTGVSAILWNLTEAYRRAKDDNTQSKSFPVPSEEMKRLRCPMLRAGRLIKMICDEGYASDAACGDKGFGAPMTAALSLPNQEKLCPIESKMDEGELFYTPIPYSEFDQWTIKAPKQTPAYREMR